MKQPNCGVETSAIVPGLRGRLILSRVSHLPLRFTVSPSPPASPGLTITVKDRPTTCSETVSQGRVFTDTFMSACKGLKATF